MKTKATFTVELEFDTEKPLGKEDIICTMNKMVDTLKHECNAGNGLATTAGCNEGHTTQITITSVEHPYIGTRTKLG